MGSIIPQMSNDSAYTPAQVAQYLARVGLPASFHPSAHPVLDLAYLTRLFVHQITTFPYENLALHYSPQHAVDLDPQVLFAKLVASPRGRGGYCMEINLLFNHVLRALGFDVYTAGVKIRQREGGVPSGPYWGWVHLVNIVTLPDPDAEGGERFMRYALDAAFGGDGPTVPMPLVDGLVHANGIGAQEIRLVRELIPAQRWRGADAPRMWVYQYRNGAEMPWHSTYAFYEVEFAEADFQVVNWFASQSPESPQRSMVLAILFLRGPKGADDEGRERVAGKMMLVDGEVKRNVRGRTELVKVCKTEEERVEALREYFGIELTPEERESIRGRVVELKGST